MKLKAFKTFIVLCLLCLFCPIVTLAKEVTGIKNIPIYKVYNPVSSEYLYLTDRNEVSSLVKAGWNDEGLAWYAPRSGQEVYRLNNPNSGNHLYTTDLNEVNALCSTAGWQKDKNGLPVFYSGGETPVYRLKSTINGVYYLTSDAGEYERLSGGRWKPEGATLAATTETFTQTYKVGRNTIENTPSEYAIEADVRLSGSGSGYHGKLVACTSSSAVSFGIQYDQHAKQPYTDATTFLIENVHSNDSGGQDYIRTGYANLNRAYRLLLAVQKDGTCNVCIDGVKIQSVKNPNLKDKVYLRVEGSGRVNNDKVDARFYNIKVKEHGRYTDNFIWGTHNFDTNKGIKSKDTYDKNRNVFISGTITGLKEGQDWDNAYDKCSGIIQFVG